MWKVTTLSGRTTGLRWLKLVLPLSETSLLIISVIPGILFAVTIYKSNFSAKYKMVTGILFTIFLKDLKLHFFLLLSLIIESERGRACLATDCLYSLQWRTVWFCELRRWQFKSQIISHVLPFVMKFEIFQIPGFLIEFQKLVLTRCFCLKAILSSGFSSETL